MNEALAACDGIYSILCIIIVATKLFEKLTKFPTSKQIALTHLDKT